MRAHSATASVPPLETAPRSFERASPWRRLAARGVDLLLFLPLVATSFLFRTDPQAALIGAAFNLVHFLIFITYEFVGFTRFGRTIGKHVLGLRVIGLAGNLPTKGAVLRRMLLLSGPGSVAQLLFTVPLLVSVVQGVGTSTSLLDPSLYVGFPWLFTAARVLQLIGTAIAISVFRVDCRGLHDLWAGTRVVHLR